MTWSLDLFKGVCGSSVKDRNGGQPAAVGVRKSRRALLTAQSDTEILCESSIGCGNLLKESPCAVVVEKAQVTL